MDVDWWDNGCSLLISENWFFFFFFMKEQTNTEVVVGDWECLFGYEGRIV